MVFGLMRDLVFCIGKAITVIFILFYTDYTQTLNPCLSAITEFAYSFRFSCCMSTSVPVICIRNTAFIQCNINIILQTANTEALLKPIFLQ